MFVPYPTVVLILSLEASKHVLKWWERNPQDEVQKLGGRKEDACWLPFFLRLVRCKSKPARFRILTPIQHFFIFSFFAGRYWQSMALVSQFSLLWLEDSSYEHCRWVMSKVTSATNICENLFPGCSMRCEVGKNGSFGGALIPVLWMWTEHIVGACFWVVTNVLHSCRNGVYCSVFTFQKAHTN